MFAIICQARVGAHLGIRSLVLVDRTLNRKRWWTSDRAAQIRRFASITEAQDMVAKLKHNRAKIITVAQAEIIVNAQRAEIHASREDPRHDDSWDSHKIEGP